MLKKYAKKIGTLTLTATLLMTSVPVYATDSYDITAFSDGVEDYGISQDNDTDIALFSAGGAAEKN